MRRSGSCIPVASRRRTLRHRRRRRRPRHRRTRSSSSTRRSKLAEYTHLRDAILATINVLRRVGVRRTVVNRRIRDHQGHRRPGDRIALIGVCQDQQF